MASTIIQNNSLVNVGDNLIIKTDLPINPNDTKVIGYHILTNDVIDKINILAGYFSIILTSEDLNLNNLNWNLLDKNLDGEDSNFSDICNSQTSSYFILFKLEKVVNSGQIINIKKVNLKVQDFNDEINQKYIFYNKSIFREIKLYNENHLKWMYNVYNKIKESGILPTFVDRDRDFSIFWEWLAHIYAVIVYYARRFLKFTDDKQLLEEYLKQKDLYKDSRFDIYTNINLYDNEDLRYTPINNQILSTEGYLQGHSSYISSSLVFVKEGNYICLFVPYSQPTVTFSLNVRVAFYDNEKICVDYRAFTLNQNRSKNLFIVPLNKQIKYMAMSFNKVIDSNKQPILLLIETYGKEYLEIDNLSKEDLLDVNYIFRNRGTQVSQKSIKTLLEVSSLDIFYSNYLNKNNIGWYLEKSCAINPFFLNKISLKKLIPNKLKNYNSGTLIEFSDNINNEVRLLPFSENNCLKLKWNISGVSKITLFVTLFDKNTKEGVYPPETMTILNKENDLNGIVIENIPTNLKEINIPLIVIQNILQKNISSSLIKVNYIKDIYLFVKNVELNNQIKDLYYLSVNSIFLQQKSIFTNDLLTKESIDDINKIFLGFNIIDTTVSFSEISLNNINLNILDKITFNLNIKINEVSNNLSVSSSILEIDRKLGYKILQIQYQNKNFCSILIRLSKENFINENSFVINEPEINKAFLDSDSNGHWIYNVNKNIDIDFCLSKLPFNLGFLNSPYYYLNYIKNNGVFSDKNVEEIISQKFLPYNSHHLFVNSGNLDGQIIRPLSFLTFDIINSTQIYKEGILFDGILNLSWKGGVSDYIITISGKNSNNEVYLKSFEFTTTSAEISIPTGKYNLVLTDNLGKTLIKKNIVVSALTDIEASFKFICMVGDKATIDTYQSTQKYDEVSIKLNGGASPYTVVYEIYHPLVSAIRQISVEANEEKDMLGIKMLRGQEQQIVVSDKYDNVKRFYISHEKYYDMWDDGEGSCIIN